MIEVTIGGIPRAINSGRDIDAAWIREQMSRQQARGSMPCVTVRVVSGGSDVRVSSCTCSTPVDTTPFRRAEVPVLTLWKDTGLAADEFTADQLIRFLMAVVALQA